MFCFSSARKPVVACKHEKQISTIVTDTCMCKNLFNPYIWISDRLKLVFIIQFLSSASLCLFLSSFVIRRHNQLFYVFYFRMMSLMAFCLLVLSTLIGHVFSCACPQLSARDTFCGADFGKSEKKSFISFNSFVYFIAFDVVKRRYCQTRRPLTVSDDGTPSCWRHAWRHLQWKRCNMHVSLLTRRHRGSKCRYFQSSNVVDIPFLIHIYNIFF